MISFKCDYGEGAHPRILERLAETNFESCDGYGFDPYTLSAREKILQACGCPDGEVFLLTGGTQTNSTVIASLLHDYQGVVSADTGHIGVHEAGAVEYTGHKVISLPGKDGKLDPATLEEYLDGFLCDPNRDHMVWPGLVYLSLPTEYGTLYSRAELEAIRTVAAGRGLPVFIDGARLGYALASPACDFTLAQLKDLCDVFYIGGTKVGALCGEAVVFPNRAPAHFFTQVKQHGALLAKGRLTGIQFDTLFTDGLYERISAHAIRMARKMVGILREKGYPFFLESPTNQQFVILENSLCQALENVIGFDVWQPDGPDHTVVRFATSWATTEAQLEQLRLLLPDHGA